ncbi:hypothetical protein [Streptomyces sp. NPDC050121]|uniref:hypothetical protein n=1 Tax=Streptomyces sp. NPDC050121 TaxID=3365601 RepID=UPI00378D2FCF
MVIDGEVIDDLLILAQGRSIDGPGGILGQAGPTHVRPPSAGSAASLPAKGIMSSDTADLEQMEQDGTLNDVITHEMGHVLGIGSVWNDKGLLADAGTSNPTFLGRAAMDEYRPLRGALAGDRLRQRVDVPVHCGPWQPHEPHDGGEPRRPGLRGGH